MNKKVLDIDWDVEGTVVSRPNRFVMIADVEDSFGCSMEGERVHVHDPGRLKEIIFPGNRVRLKRAIGKGRKTSWTLVAGLVGDRWVLVNSSYHRYISQIILDDPEMSPFRNTVSIKPEVRVGSSRLDYMITSTDGNRCFIEVKGCSLSRNGVALFPDAPTKRGTRHVMELIGIRDHGDGAAILILVLAPHSRVFSPNRDTDPNLADAMAQARISGVEIHAVDLDIEDGSIIMKGFLPVDII